MNSEETERAERLVKRLLSSQAAYRGCSNGACSLVPPRTDGVTALELKQLRMLSAQNPNDRRLKTLLKQLEG